MTKPYKYTDGQMMFHHFKVTQNGHLVFTDENSGSQLILTKENALDSVHELLPFDAQRYADLRQSMEDTKKTLNELESFYYNADRRKGSFNRGKLLSMEHLTNPSDVKDHIIIGG